MDFRPRIPIESDKEKKLAKILMHKIRLDGLQGVLNQLTVPQSILEEMDLKRCQKWLVLSDVHRPFHNKKIWNKVLRLIRDMGKELYGICLAGDYLDLYTLGSYNAESLGLLKGIDLAFEYQDGLDGLLELQAAAHEGVKKLFLYGNHEDRYFRTVNSKDNAKYGAALKDPIEALYLHEHGWQVKTNWKDDYFTLGEHLDVVHGTYHNKHVAAKHLDQTQHSVVFGHTHRIQSFHLGNKAAYNIGGLFDINNNAFGYMPRFTRSQWANGFAIVYIDEDGCYHVNQVTIWDNCFYAEGKMY
jgi:predicted phosphodiesterase